MLHEKVLDFAYRLAIILAAVNGRYGSRVCHKAAARVKEHVDKMPAGTWAKEKVKDLIETVEKHVCSKELLVVLDKWLHEQGVETGGAT